MPDFHPDLPEIDDFHRLFLDSVPLLDVRAPVEFSQGAFPAAQNQPLIDDEERHRIGITYKEDGQDAAVALGADLIDGATKEQRIAEWQQFFQTQPMGALYCFRGGMRSKITQQWLFEATGHMYPRIKGGYKAMRRYLIAQLETAIPLIEPIVLGGQTGAGKTVLLRKLQPILDLEHLANHRGSAFGRRAIPQPTQIDFENALSIDLLKLLHAGNRRFLIEDESRNIGARHLSNAFFERLSSAPVVVLEASLDERVDITLQEYVHEALAEYQKIYGENEGFDRWVEYVTVGQSKISKRLGGERYKTAVKLLQEAIIEPRDAGTVQLFREGVALLLNDYYGAMYSYQLEKKKDRIVFMGEKDAATDYLQQHYNIQQILK